MIVFGPFDCWRGGTFAHVDVVKNTFETMKPSLRPAAFPTSAAKCKPQSDLNGVGNLTFMSQTCRTNACVCVCVCFTLLSRRLHATVFVENKKSVPVCPCLHTEWVELFTGAQSRVCFVRGLVLVCVET